MAVDANDRYVVWNRQAGLLYREHGTDGEGGEEVARRRLGDREQAQADETRALPAAE